MRELTDLEKRLIAVMNIGAWIEDRDGHRWICCKRDYCGEYDPSVLDTMLEETGVRLNSKIYGGYLSALDTIDEAFRQAGEPTLRERFDQRWATLGEMEYDIFLDGVGENRIDRVEPGKGGLS